LNLNDIVAIALCALALVALSVSLWAHRRNPYAGLRKTRAVANSAALSQAAAEQGQRLIMALGTGPALSVNSLAGLSVLEALSRRSIFTDQPVHAVSGSGVLASLSQSVVRGTYQGAVAPELFKPDDALLAGLTPFGYLTGLLPQAASRANAGLLLYGPHRPESILAVDLAERKGYPVVALSPDLSAQAVLLASSADVGLGEDYYDAGASLLENRSAAAAQHAQDVLRILIAIGLLAGAILRMLGVWQ
jgi:hypothetical protein